MTTIQNLKIADLKPYPGNPRDNDGAVPGVVASIRQYGFIGAIIENKDKVIINGHTRVKAMKELGADTIPAIVVEHLTPEQERDLRIADNKTGEVATWNMDLLKAELKALQEAGFDMGTMGFDTSELDELLGGDTVEVGQTDPDDAPEVPEAAVSEPGEVYVLGRHLLVCGDSTKAEDVAKICGDGEADCWLTDPPYNVDYHGSDGQTIRNDSMEDSKFREFLRTAFGCAEKAMKPGAAFYVFHADSEGYNFRGHASTWASVSASASSGRRTPSSSGGRTTSGFTSHACTAGRTARRTAGMATAPRPRSWSSTSRRRTTSIRP